MIKVVLKKYKLLNTNEEEISYECEDVKIFEQDAVNNLTIPKEEEEYEG